MTVAGAVFAALMTGIVANAMFFQKGHHPAPLLKPNAPAAPVDPPQPPARTEVVSPPTVAPAPPPASPTEAPVAPAPVSTPAAKPAPIPKATAANHPHKTVAHAHQDAIGDLLGNLAHDGAKTAAKPSGGGATPAPHPRAAKAPAHLVKDAAAPQQ